MLRALLILLLLISGCSKSESDGDGAPVTPAASPDEMLRDALGRFARGDRTAASRLEAAFDAVASSGVQPKDAALLRALLDHLVPLPPDALPPRALVNTTLALAALEGVEVARAPLAARVAEHPDAFSPLLALGFLARVFGFLEPSRQWFERAAESDPTRPEPHFELGTLRAGAGDLEGAVACFDRAIERESDDARSRYYRARAIAELGRMDEALAAWRALAAESGEYASRAANDVGSFLLRSGDREAALEAFLAAAAAAPDRPAPQLNTGSLLTNLGRGAEAIPYLERAHRLRDDDPRPSTLLGQVFEEDGRADDAEAQYREALRRAPEYETARYRLSLLLRRTGREAEADALAEGRGS